ncbi:MAG: pentapeptide repeat-containing protein [Anaerolineae bacterium]|nr:pentapeptide repeat-containing protein [Anaerolineae bacterium]
MNLVTEIIGVWASVGVTVLVIDRIYANRDREKDKQRLRHDAATGDNEIAIRAINAMRYEKILTSKRGILKRAYLTGAKLQGADMHGANLSGAVLHSANLV